MSTNKLSIGLFGFGVVGKGLYDVLHSTPTLQASIKKICIKNARKKEVLVQKILLQMPMFYWMMKNINVIVELIDDADAAFDYCKNSHCKTAKQW